MPISRHGPGDLVSGHPGDPSDLILQDERTRVEIVPRQGARVRSLRDLHSGRELLYRRPGETWDPGDYTATLAGGWDQMFPNDDPWQDFPVHGSLWPTGFAVAGASMRRATLRCRLGAPAVEVEHRYDLLEPPRVGLRLTTTVHATAAVGPFLWATHPMLAVAPGWQIDVGDVPLEADGCDPGRATPGLLSPTCRATVLGVPEGGLGWQEVLYAPATGTAAVTSPDGRRGTRISWDVAFFRHLWVVTLSGFASANLALVLEPCTTRPYRLDEAIAAGEAATLATGAELTFWSEVESLDDSLST
jgi:hypothetical protein